MQTIPFKRFAEAQINAVANAIDDRFDESVQISPEKLKQILNSRGMDADALADQLLDELRFPVREYAHRYTNKKSNVRRDFAETLCWQPLLITDADGKATVRFDLPDSITSFKVRIDGHTDNGKIGSGNASVISQIPFQLEPKLPLEVTSGDRIDLPIGIINRTDKSCQYPSEY